MGGVAQGPTRVLAWLWVQVRRGVCCVRALESLGVIEFDFLSRNLCDHGLSVCSKVDELFLQGTSGHFSGGDWQRLDFIAVSQLMGILHDESLHYLK